MSQAAPAQRTLQSIKQIIRRDLKLGESVVLSDDMPLVGGDLDLDSLDVLLLLTSLEKEFGFKITSETIDRSAFASVRTLALYIEQRGASGGGGGAAQAVEPAAMLARLPHGEPFRFVTAMGELRPGVEGTAVWRLSGAESFFAGHFPGRPLVPGVLVAEALAQLSGIVGLSGGGGGEGRLANVNVRFREVVPPPVEIELRSKVKQSMGGLMQFDVEARVGGRVIAEGSLALNLAGAV